jgi:hypothetical protein
MDFDFLPFQDIEIDEWLINWCESHGDMILLLYFHMLFYIKTISSCSNIYLFKLFSFCNFTPHSYLSTVQSSKTSIPKSSGVIIL